MGSDCHLVCTCQMHIWCKFGDCRSITCRDNKHISIFYGDLKPGKVGQGDLFLLCDQGPLVGLCVQDYMFLCAAVTICATLFNILIPDTQTNTHRQYFDQLISIAQSAERNMQSIADCHTYVFPKVGLHSFTQL